MGIDLAKWGTSKLRRFIFFWFVIAVTTATTQAIWVYKSPEFWWLYIAVVFGVATLFAAITCPLTWVRKMAAPK